MIKTAPPEGLRHIRSAVRAKPNSNPAAEDVAVPQDAVVDNVLRMYRLDGVGDMLFMEPAVRKLKARLRGAELVLHTRRRYQEIAGFIGFDRAEIEENKALHQTGSLNLNWALEHHAAAFVLDRVSIWEDILRIQTGDETVRIYAPKYGTKMLEASPQYDPKKPSLYFCPFSVYRDRSFAPAAVRAMLPQLLGRFNVVVTHPKIMRPDTSKVSKEQAMWIDEKLGTIEHCGASGCCMFPETGISDWLALASACDVAISSDTGGMYVAAGSGVPTVGVFEHVEPWLRLQRFEQARGLFLRLPSCKCDHHGPCTHAREICRDSLTPAVVLANLEAVMDGAFGYFNADGAPISRPLVEFRIEGEGATEDAIRRSEFGIAEAARGLHYMVRRTTDPKSTQSVCKIAVAAGSIPARAHVWHTVANAVRPRGK